MEIREVELHFRCTNTYLATKDGPGRYVAKGIGLDNVRKRLKLLYPGRHRLDIQTEGGQYVVKLELGLGNSI